ncbi:MAG: DUF167 family protein [Rhodospirillaceae bacterium]
MVRARSAVRTGGGTAHVLTDRSPVVRDADRSPVVRTARGVRLSIRVTARASRNAVSGPVADADGRMAVRVAVTAAAEGGKANAAVLGLLAKTWGIPKTSMTVIAGATDRRKILEIAGDPDMLAARIERWMEENADG